MSDTDGTLFLGDLEAKPASLRELADAIDAGGLRWPIEALPARVLLTGMGSSWFAAQTAALRLRRAGVNAVAEISSVSASWPASDDLLVVGISASGGSSETLSFLEAYPSFVALTNKPASTMLDRAPVSVPMHAGPELSGVSCRSFQHTLAALLVLEEQLTDTALDVAARVRAAADASEALLTDRSWLDEVSVALDGPHGVYALAPAERISSAMQSALMVREGPRRPAAGCDMGDWSHVDVYLTKTLDYRALVFAGGPHEAAARRWMSERGSTVVSVGPGEPGDAANVRFPGDDDPIVALLTELLVAELLAERWWTA